MSTITVSLPSLLEGEIRAASPSVCVVRTSQGVTAFGRICPHAGADLTNGYIENGQLRCVWHNVPFDLRDGRSPCAALRPLQMYRVTERGPDCYEIEVERR